MFYALFRPVNPILALLSASSCWPTPQLARRVLGRIAAMQLLSGIRSFMLLAVLVEPLREIPVPMHHRNADQRHRKIGSRPQHVAPSTPSPPLYVGIPDLRSISIQKYAARGASIAPVTSRRGSPPAVCT